LAPWASTHNLDEVIHGFADPDMIETRGIFTERSYASGSRFDSWVSRSLPVAAAGITA
jgi:hypothetical protein